MVWKLFYLIVKKTTWINLEHGCRERGAGHSSSSGWGLNSEATFSKQSCSRYPSSSYLFRFVHILNEYLQSDVVLQLYIEDGQCHWRCRNLSAVEFYRVTLPFGPEQWFGAVNQSEHRSFFHEKIEHYGSDFKRLHIHICRNTCHINAVLFLGSSTIGSIFLLINAALGAGLLNFPKAFNDAGGIEIALAVQAVLLLFVIVSLLILAKCSDINGALTVQVMLSL